MGEDARTSFADGLEFSGGVTPDYRGWLSAWLPSVALEKERAGLVVDAIRMDRWLKYGRGRSSISREDMRHTMMERLYPSDPEWRAKAMANGLDAQLRALKGLRAW